MTAQRFQSSWLVRRSGLIAVAATVGMCFSTTQRSFAADPSSALELFETKIRPVLVEVCFKCHGGDKVSNGLRVDSREALLKGGDTAAAVVLGKPAESLLVEALRHSDKDLKMPPDKKLPDETIAAFEAWITADAPWPTAKLGELSPFQVRKHWAFQPVVRPSVPQIRNPKSEIRNAIDAFVWQKLDASGLSPSLEADRRTLLRRATFDLHGLPPTPEAIFAFEADPSPQAFEHVVDRLLASQRYGERWGRYWLDVSRYADTKGYVFMEDRNYPFAYTYRDWVIRSLNEDMPYDQFLIRQIAADLLPEPERTASLPALGFLTLGRRFLNNINDIIDDRIDVVCRGTLALTVTCARCHDHKYDPIPAADYYSLYGIFRSSREPKADEVKSLMAMTLVEEDNPFEPYVFLRGQQGNHGPRVPRQFLSAVAGPDRKPFANRSGRLELAQAIASPTNPLTARVIVNRVWMQHFGAPLVRTPSDFGLRCEPASHPELLEWLSAELIEHGWSLKWLHRELMRSAVWRQASGERQLPDGHERLHDTAHNSDASGGLRPPLADPENKLLSHMNRRRLDWEALRDSLLFASGRLDHSMGGPATDLFKPPFATCRTVYGFIDRQNLPLVLRTFDFASPDTHAPSRFVTSVPQQTLFLRNSPFVIEQARALAVGAFANAAVSSPLRGERQGEGRLNGTAATTTPADIPRPLSRTLSPEGRGSRTELIAALFQLVYGREPSADERALAGQFLRDAQQEAPTAPIWQFGFGEYDAATKSLKSFSQLPHSTGSAWQGGPMLPDEKLGWVLWRANGGHPGDAQHSAIIRWTAPNDMTVVISGQLKHDSEQGDGVMALVWSSQLGERARWIAHRQSANTFVPATPVRRGESLDFIVTSRTNENSDSFSWSPKLATAENGFNKIWDFSADFPKGQNSQTPDAPLTPWEQLAQVLLLSNEFQFVD